MNYFNELFEKYKKVLMGREMEIKKIDNWYKLLSEKERYNMMNAISPDELDDDFWEYLTDDLKRIIYKEAEKWK